MAPTATRKVWWVAILAVLIVLIVALQTAFASSYQIAEHADCALGTPVATGVFWTPVAIVDSPPEYNSTTSFANASGWAPNVAPALFNVSDGEAAGVFSLDSWVLYSESRQWEFGPGAVATCPSVKGVDLSRSSLESPQPTETFTELLPRGSLSDVAVPNTVNLSGPGASMHESVYFIANYSDGYSNLPFSQITGEIGLAGSGGAVLFAESQVGGTYFIVVPFMTPTGSLVPYVTWLTGVETTEYYISAPWYGCIQWAGSILNPFGTGLSFGPAPTTGFGCTFP